MENVLVGLDEEAASQVAVDWIIDRAQRTPLHVTLYTAFDMVMLNHLDRYKLAIDVLDRVPGLAATHAEFRQELEDSRIRARAYTREHGEDIPEVAGWTWPRD